MATGNDEKLKLPARVRPGEAVRAGQQNAVRKALKALDGEVRRRTPQGSASHGVRRTAGGFQYFHKRPPRGMEKVVGLMPVSRGLGTSGTETPGVGLVASRMTVLTTKRDNAVVEAEQVQITLGGTVLESDPAPRETLAEGEWDAWVVYKLIWGANEARVIFKALGAGVGAIDDDEQPVLVASFAVTLPSATETEEGETIPQVPKIEILEQYVHGDLQVWEELHPWKALKTGTDTIVIRGGTVVWPEGTKNADKIVAANEKCADSGEFTITAAGSIWLKLTWRVGQHSLSEVDLGSGLEFELRMYRIDYLAFDSYEFKATASPPVAGDDDADIFASGDLYYELCRVELVGGEVQVTEQCIEDTIFAPELVDAILQEPVTP